MFPAVLFFLGTKHSVLFGTFFLQLWYILDHVDGEIARYRKASTTTGIYFDGMVHYIAHPIVFAGLGWGLFRQFDLPVIHLFTFSVVISSVLISAVFDFKKAVLFDAGRSRKKEEPSVGKQDLSLLRRIFSLVHITCIFPHLMNILTVAAFIDFFSGSSIVLYVFIYFAFAMPLVWIGKLAFSVINRELD